MEQKEGEKRGWNRMEERRGDGILEGEKRGWNRMKERGWNRMKERGWNRMKGRRGDGIV